MSGYKKGANSRDGTPADRKSGGSNTGSHDFSGQEGYDPDPQGETPESEAREPRDARVNFQRQHGKHDGNGGSVKIIPPNGVHGSNR